VGRDRQGHRSAKAFMFGQRGDGFLMVGRHPDRRSGQAD
jgi:hypothetical protein